MTRFQFLIALCVTYRRIIMTILKKYPSKSTPGQFYEIRKSYDLTYCTCWQWKKKRWCSHLNDYFENDIAKEAQCCEKHAA